jgi:hypothetical protein
MTTNPPPAPLTRAEVLTLSDREFETAMKRHAWRDAPANPTQPPAQQPSAQKHARDMTDAEFEEANRRKAWRDSIAAKPLAQIATADSRPAPETRQDSTSSGGTAPTPAGQHATGLKPAMLLTDAEYAEACRTHAWRVGTPNR